jgi:chemotaxis protein MotB
VADVKHELVIIKRSRGGSHEPHGGAWKIAFADFMTAMMALFLVLWLVNATNTKTKASLARYFNPVDLVDMSTHKRGLHDPHAGPETDGAADGASFPKSADKAAKKKGSEPGFEDGAAGPSDSKINQDALARTVEPPPTHSEEALFRDPYAVLAEIAASGSSGQAASGEQLDQQDDDANGLTTDTYADPFKPADKAAEMAPTVTPQPAPQAAPAQPAAVSTSNVPAPAPDDKSAPAAPAPDASHPAAIIASASNAPAKTDSKKQQALSATQALALKLQQEIAKLIGPAGKDAAKPAIEVKAVDEGVLISLTDQADFAMFAIGSAEPQPKTVHIMDKVGRALKSLSGDLIIGGFTDGRPYRTGVYDNWRLSSARAQMAYYMLVRGGVDQKRIVRIEGYADRRLKVPSKPLADENRRIEIFLKEAKS